MGSLLLSLGPGTHKFLFVSKSMFPQSCVSSGSCMVGLTMTSSKGLMPNPGLLHPEPLPQQQPTADPYLCRRHSNILLSQSPWVSGSWCTQGLFEPLQSLWQVCSSILNVISPLLPSPWGFFAFGHGVSFFGGSRHSAFDSCSAASC